VLEDVGGGDGVEHLLEVASPESLEE